MVHDLIAINLYDIRVWLGRSERSPIQRALHIFGEAINLLPDSYKFVSDVAKKEP